MKAPFLAVPIFGLQNSVWQSLSMVAFGMAAKTVVVFQRRTRNIGILKIAGNIAKPCGIHYPRNSGQLVCPLYAVCCEPEATTSNSK
jgi:hypothetical protein